MRSALIIFLANYCAFLFSQDFNLSRGFVYFNKNFPTHILNHHPNYFYVIRQNKVVHDITIERRAKPSAEIISFTPLKMDSVNANWFNYGNLDYIVFEKNHKLYFVFEKVLNTKRTLYLKVIDTTGRSSGFIEVATLESDNNTADFYFTVSPVANNNLLVRATKTTLNGLTRKILLLFSTEKRQLLWTKRLALEDGRTLDSWDYTCNEENDLLYIQERGRITGSETFQGHTRYFTERDSVVLVHWKKEAPAPNAYYLTIPDLFYPKTSYMSLNDREAFISVMGLELDTLSGEMQEAVINTKMDYTSGKEIYAIETPYTPKIKEQLTFYLFDTKSSSVKRHYFLEQFRHSHYSYALFERSSREYVNELLFRKVDMNTGEIAQQLLIPRKTAWFKEYSRFKYQSEPMIQFREGNLRIVLLEHAANSQAGPDNFKFKQFKGKGNPYEGSIVQYLIKSDGTWEKGLVYTSSTFDLIPLKYDGWQEDMVFYLVGGKEEKFAIWKPNP